MAQQETDRKIALEQDAARENIAGISNAADHELLESLYERRKNILAMMEDDEEGDGGSSEELHAIDRQIRSIEERAGIGPRVERGNDTLQTERQARRTFILDDYTTPPARRLTSDGEGGES